MGKPTYRNRPVRTMPKVIGRIASDLIDFGQRSLRQFDSNAVIIQAPESPDVTPGDCCCENAVYVAPTADLQFNTIQGAIDWIAANETPSATEPWVVRVCSGTYAEHVVGQDYVSIEGTGPRGSVIISGATGPLYTLPDIGGHLVNVKLNLVPTTDLQEAVEVPGSHTGPTVFWDVLFACSSATNGIKATMVDLNAGTMYFYDNEFEYTMTGSAAGVKIHNIIDIDGAAFFHLYRCDATISVGDEHDTVIFVNEDTAGTVQSFIHGNIIRMYLTHASYDGTSGVFYLHGAGTNKFIQANQLHIESNGFNSDTGYLIWMNTAAGGGIVNSIANHGRVAGFTNNYSIRVNGGGAGDNIFSHCDKIYSDGADPASLANAFQFAGSYNDGQFSTSSHVNVGDELRCWLGNFHAGFKAQAALAGNRMWSLPLIDGAADKWVLVTDSAFNLRFLDSTTIPGIVQDLWETIVSDAGNTVADSPTDTLTIIGANGVATSIAGDTLTITGPSLLGFYFDDLADVSGIGGYKTICNMIPAGAQATLAQTGKNTDGEMLLGAFVTPPGCPGIAVLPSGEWDFHIYAHVSNATNESYIKLYIYKRNIAGAETALFNVTSADIDDLAVTLQHFLYTQVSDISLDVSDRLVVKAYFYTTRPADVTMTFTYDGLVNVSHFHTPLAAGASSDVKVAVDAAAIPNFIGAASNDGVLRTGSGLIYTDGGDFVTVDRKATQHMTLFEVQQADTQWLLANRAWQNETLTYPIGYANQIDHCRTVTVRCTNIDGVTNMTGTVTINGIDADGAVIQEVVTVDVPKSSTVMYTTDRAFYTVTSIVAVKTDAHFGGDTYEVGVADEWGIENYPLNAAGDVFKLIWNGDHDIVSAVNTVYGTVIFTQAIITGDTLEIVSRPNK